MQNSYRDLRQKCVSKNIIVATFPHMKAIADADTDEVADAEDTFIDVSSASPVAAEDISE